MHYYIFSIIATPAMIFLSMATEGSVLPSLGRSGTWTIEYMPMVLSSIFGICLSIKGYKETKKKIWLCFSCSFNILIGLSFVYAIITFWGDKL